MTLSRRDLLGSGFALCGSWYASSAAADGSARGPISLVVPFAPGGNVDITARTVAPGLGRALNRSVVVYNRAGAGGAIGAAFVAQSDPNGATLLLTVPDTLTIVPQMMKTPYQFDSFKSVGSVAATTPLIVVKKGSRFPTIGAFVDAARANPGKITVAHDGLGSASHIALVQFQKAARCTVNMIPYKGSSPAIVDLLGGQIDAAVDQMTSSLPHLSSGVLRALVAMSKTRDPLIPSIPTLRESGIAYDVQTVLGIFAPGKTPRRAIEQLDSALKGVLSDPKVKSQLSALGSNAQYSSPHALELLVAEENTLARGMASAGMLESR